MPFFRNASPLRTTQRALLLVASGLAALGLTAAPSQAQAPQASFDQSLIPPDVPASALIGDLVTFKVRFKNTATAIGYGPFIDLAINFGGNDDNNASGPCDGLDFVSAQMVGVSGGPLPLTGFKSGNTNPGACANTTAPHLYLGNITLPQPGWQLITIPLPFGSFDMTQPEIVVEVTARVHNFADLGVSLGVCKRGGFQYGASATGTTPIVQPLTTNNVTSWPGCEKIGPEVVQFKKQYLGPENETATGPNFPHPYLITLDVATGQTVGKPLTVKDCIPDGMAYQGNLSVLSPHWPPPPHIPLEPPTSSCLEVSWINIAAIGGLGTDATVQFDFSVADQYANGNQVLDDSCKPVLLDNPLSVSAAWTPLDPRDPSTTINQSITPAHQLWAKCLAIQKSVKVVTEFSGGGAGPTPGDLLQYTLDFQVSDYKTLGQIKITDFLSNGQIFQTTPAPSLKVGDRMGGPYTISMLPYYTSTQDPSATFKDCPITGANILSFDVSGALSAVPPNNPRQLAGILTGGYAATPTSATPATGTLTFYAKIADTFNNMPVQVRNVDKDDPLCNAVDIKATVYKNNANPGVLPAAVSPPQAAEDTSGTGIAIVTNILTKAVYAVKRNGVWICGPSFLGSQPACAPSGQQVFPSDEVTFRLQYDIPSADAQNLLIRDWLPLPKFNVTGMTWNTSPCAAAAIPLAGQACRASGHTLTVGPTFSVLTGNSIRFAYGTFSSTLNASRKIDLLFTSTVTNNPMADKLLLTNEVQECEDNSFGTTFCQTAIAQVEVREPKLSVRKGVIATDNVNALFTPPGGPTTSGTLAPAPLGVTFSLAGVLGTVTSASIANPNLFNSDLYNVDANDLATFAVVIENQGGYPAFNVHLDDLMPSAGGAATCFTLVPNTIKIRNGAGQTLTPAGLNTSAVSIGVDLASIPAASANGSNIIIITFQVKLIASIKAGCCTNTATLTKYTSSPSSTAPNFVTANVGGPFSDPAKICVSPSASAKCIQATSEAHTTSQQVGQSGLVNAAIGEIVRFRLITIIPEGTTQNFQIKDMLPVGLTYIPGTARALFVANNPVINSFVPAVPTISAVHGGVRCPAVPGVGIPTTPISESPASFPVGAGTDPQFAAASVTITNNDNDPDLEYLIIEFNAQVDNIATNQNATQLPNTFAVQFTDAFSGQMASSNSGAVTVAVVEPQLTLGKSASPTTVGPTTSLVTYTVNIANTGSATAFDLAFSDTFPAGFVAGNFVSAVPTGCTSSSSGLTLGLNCSSPGYAGLLPGSTLAIKYEAKVTPLSCPSTLTNHASVTWTSLPGPNGTPNGTGVNTTGSSTAGSSGAGNGERNGTTAPLSLNDYLASGMAAINCVPPSRDLVVAKLYNAPPGMAFPVGAQLTFKADCWDPGNLSTPHVTQTVTISTTTSGGPSSFGLGNAPVGWTCNFTEMVPNPGTGCYWAPGLAFTPNPITVQLSTINGIGFTNNYVCPAHPRFDLAVIKARLVLAPTTPPSEGFVITVQNVGNQPLTGADLHHLTVTDNLPAGSTVTGYGNTSMTEWSCPSTPTAAPVTCTYVGPLSSLAPFAGLPQLQIIATPGTGPTQYTDPVTGALTTAPPRSNCAVISLQGTGTTPTHDDTFPANNVACTQF